VEWPGHLGEDALALMPGHDDVGVPQFDARFGGEAGHDLISVS